MHQLAYNKFVCLFTVLHLHLYRDVTFAGEHGEGLQNLGLCSALRAFEQGGIFIVPHLLLHGTSLFPFSSIQLPLMTHKESVGPIFTQILTSDITSKIISSVVA
jgi:hypothetical protein